MGLFMESSKRVVVKNIAANNHVQIDTATTLSFYIRERAQETELTSVEYQVEKISGRSSEVLTSWTSISLIDVDNDIYTFDYSVTGVTTTDKLLFRFKVIDVEGMEYFIDVNNITIIS